MAHFFLPIRKALAGPWAAKRGRFSFRFLNITQFLGVLNDNLYKFFMIFLLIDTLGANQASAILSAAGAIYVLPFLLFSSSAGILADRMSKQKLIMLLKVAEAGIMILAVFAFVFKSTWGCYSLLFLLATHSAMFGPSKYGIISELVPKETVSKANGIITSFTYLAIILGTFLASFLTEITNRNFVIAVLFCLVVALGGFVSVFGIKRTSAQKSNQHIHLFFIREIYLTLKSTKAIPKMLSCICGSSFFLFVGAYTQLNIIPFAIDSLNLSAAAGGYLFLITALGIALGSFFTGKLLKKKLELGISCIAGFGLGLSFLFLSLFSFSLPFVACILAILGILGGVFIIPFDTFIQLNSPEEKRGQMIAATNFLSFLGVLIASCILYVLGAAGIPPAAGFALIGFSTLLVVLFLSLALAEAFFPFLSKKVLYPLFRIRSPDALPEKASLWFLEEATLFKALLCTAFLPECSFLMETTKSPLVNFFLKKIPHLHFIEEGQTWKEAAEPFKKEPLCILLPGLYAQEEPLQKKSRFPFFSQTPSIALIQIGKEDKSYSIRVSTDSGI